MITLKGEMASKFRTLISLFSEYKKAPYRNITIYADKFIHHRYEIKSMSRINEFHENEGFTYYIKKEFELIINDNTQR